MLQQSYCICTPHLIIWNDALTYVINVQTNWFIQLIYILKFVLLYYKILKICKKKLYHSKSFFQKVSNFNHQISLCVCALLQWKTLPNTDFTNVKRHTHTHKYGSNYCHLAQEPSTVSPDVDGVTRRVIGSSVMFSALLCASYTRRCTCPFLALHLLFVGR